MSKLTFTDISKLDISVKELLLDMCDDLEKAALKSIPLKVVTFYDVSGKIYGECPDCKHTGLKKHIHQHCWWCGQKLDWNKTKLKPLNIDL